MPVRQSLVPLRAAIVVCLSLGIASCAKKRGDAIVVGKEHIDVAEAKPLPSPAASPSPGASPVNEEAVIREMAPDEIDVDGIVMKKEVRGTSKDPRAGTEETWLVKVEMVEVGDRIKVRYSEGKYTGTVWGSEIED
jgi:hypothetical protein